MNTKRLDWIDIAKGIGIILVVLGHTLVPQVRETGFAGFLWIFIIFICRYSSFYRGICLKKDFLTTQTKENSYSENYNI